MANIFKIINETEHKKNAKTEKIDEVFVPAKSTIGSICGLFTSSLELLALTTAEANRAVSELVIQQKKDIAIKKEYLNNYGIYVIKLEIKEEFVKDLINSGYSAKDATDIVMEVERDCK